MPGALDVRTPTEGFGSEGLGLRVHVELEGCNFLPGGGVFTFVPYVVCRRTNLFVSLPMCMPSCVDGFRVSSTGFQGLNVLHVEEAQHLVRRTRPGRRLSPSLRLALSPRRDHACGSFFGASETGFPLQIACNISCSRSHA